MKILQALTAHDPLGNAGRKKRPAPKHDRRHHEILQRKSIPGRR